MPPCHLQMAEALSEQLKRAMVIIDLNQYGFIFISERMCGNNAAPIH
jgi:hypothetical protein